MSRTKIAEGRLSVASVAVDYARAHFRSFCGQAGAVDRGKGKMAGLVLQGFAALKPGNLWSQSRWRKKHGRWGKISRENGPI